MFEICAIFSENTNISLHKYLFWGETTMNAVKFDCTKNNQQKLMEVKFWIQNATADIIDSK